MLVLVAIAFIIGGLVLATRSDDCNDSSSDDDGFCFDLDKPIGIIMLSIAIAGCLIPGLAMFGCGIHKHKYVVHAVSPLHANTLLSRAQRAAV